MADLTKLVKDSYVKWPINGGYSMGQIQEVLDKNIKVEFPTGQVVTVAVSQDGLSSIDVEEYEQGLEEIVSKVNRRSTKSKAKDESMTVKELEAKNAELVQAVASLTKEKEELVKANEADAGMPPWMEEKKKAESEIADLKAKLDAEVSKSKDMEVKCSTLNAKIDAMEKAEKAKSRYAKLETVGAAQSVAATQDEAYNKLADLPDEAFAMMFNVAEAGFKKLTEQTNSSSPKLTDQTVTGKPKLTEQTKAEDVTDKKEEVVAAVAEAKKEEEVKLEVAAAAVVTDDSDKLALAKFAEHAINRGRNKKVKENK